MSLASRVTASRRNAKKEAQEAEAREAYNNRFIAKKIMNAKKKHETAFPSNEIGTLTQIAYKVVADNFEMYPDLKGVKD